jgi:hypothetical protein
MNTDLLRRTARDHGNGGTGLYGLRRHGGAGMGIHDGGEWQLKVRSWELDVERRVLWRKTKEFWGRGIFCRGAWWLVLLMYFRCVRK